jgi:hypothetical protein
MKSPRLITNHGVSIHCYFVQNWFHLHVLISLEHVTRGEGFNNLTKVIIDIMKKYVGVFKTNIVMKLMSFNASSVNVFQGMKNGVTYQL